MNIGNRQRAWLQLMAGCSILALFIFGLAPAILRSQVIRPIMDYVQEQNMDASALFYTESPTTGEIEFYINKQEIHDKKDKAFDQ